MTRPRVSAETLRRLAALEKPKTALHRRNYLEHRP